jgi:cytochrome c-type biogenesis protein CcmH/NrfG
MQFLLSSDRSHLASPGELILRFTVVYFVVVTATAIVQYPLWRVVVQSQQSHADVRAVPGFPHSTGNY